MPDAIHDLGNQIFEKLFFLKKPDQGHHPGQKEDDIKARKLNNMGNIDQISRQKEGKTQKRKSQSELPVKKGPANNGHEGKRRHDLPGIKTTDAKQHTDRDQNTKNSKRLFQRIQMPFTDKRVLILNA